MRQVDLLLLADIQKSALCFGGRPMAQLILATSVSQSALQCNSFDVKMFVLQHAERVIPCCRAGSHKGYVVREASSLKVGFLSWLSLLLFGCPDLGHQPRLGFQNGWTLLGKSATCLGGCVNSVSFRRSQPRQDAQHARCNCICNSNKTAHRLISRGFSHFTVFTGISPSV